MAPPVLPAVLARVICIMDIVFTVSPVVVAAVLVAPAAQEVKSVPVDPAVAAVAAVPKAPIPGQLLVSSKSSQTAVAAVKMVTALLPPPVVPQGCRKTMSLMAFVIPIMLNGWQQPLKEQAVM